MSVPNHLKKFVSDLPESPGIYKFFDEKDRLLYIGKSINIKKRVISYFRKQGEDTHERTLRLIFHIHQIEVIQTETELEALILEDNLIKEFLPAYNIKQKQFMEQVYLAITADEYPTVKIIKSTEIDLFSTLFGPFKDRFAAGNLLNILQEILLIRTCTESVPTKKCMQFGIGKCSGPCRGIISFSEYQKKIDIAVEFLQGEPESITDIISQKITRAASELQFESATTLRDLHDFCLNFSKRQKFISVFMKENLIIKSGSSNRTFLFQRGDLVKTYKRKTSDTMIRNCFQKKKRTKVLSQVHLMDRAYVVWVWMKKKGVK